MEALVNGKAFFPSFCLGEKERKKIIGKLKYGNIFKVGYSCKTAVDLVISKFGFPISNKQFLGHIFSQVHKSCYVCWIFMVLMTPTT